MLPPDWLAGQVADRGAQVVLHLTCKDANRNALEGAAWRYASEGFSNILAITGDYPTAGFGGPAAGVFDLDSVGLIALLRSMNDGLEVPGRRGNIETLPKTDFFIGCVVSPFKRHERELMPQYFKLVRKLAAGARWVIPQLGYDMRKFHEVKLMLDSRGIKAPIVGNVYLLGKGVARVFNSGKLAGCVVTDELLNVVDRYSAGADKGKKFFLELAAKQLAVFKGLGFAAGYLGGITKPETFGQIIDLAESYRPDDWRDFIREIQFSQPDEFFLFEHDRMTGLSEPTRINPAYRRSLAERPPSKEVTLSYRLSRLVHQIAFTRDRGLFGLLRRLFGHWDQKPGLLGRAAYGLERGSKRLLYGCEECGDCNLPDCAYLCPRHACSKSGINGPCGGSAKGRCELDDKECFWARVYERLKAYGESEHMLDRPVVIYDTRLKNTSSWANFYLDRDHSAPATKAAAPAEEAPGAKSSQEKG
jgi:methylenetetrahydrofolate reductase (NADPH)